MTDAIATTDEELRAVLDVLVVPVVRPHRGGHLVLESRELGGEVDEFAVA